LHLAHSGCDSAEAFALCFIGFMFFCFLASYRTPVQWTQPEVDMAWVWVCLTYDMPFLSISDILSILMKILLESDGIGSKTRSQMPTVDKCKHTAVSGPGVRLMANHQSRCLMSSREPEGNRRDLARHGQRHYLTLPDYDYANLRKWPGRQQGLAPSCGAWLLFDRVIHDIHVIKKQIQFSVFLNSPIPCLVI